MVPLLLFELSGAWAASVPAPAKSAGKSAQAPRTAKASPKKSSSAKKKSGKRSRTRGPRGQRAPTPDRVREIQQALARHGYYQGEPTGKWDATTVAAMKAFQQGASLNPTGKLDARSLQKLGLGSGIAGLAPPRPNPPSSDSSPPRP